MQRVFIGVPVDRQTQQHINAFLEPLKRLWKDIRWEAENNRHLTLAFIGNKPTTEVENLLRSFNEIYQQETHFKYRLATLTLFPEPTSRTIALVAEPSEALDRLFQITRRFLQRHKVELDLKAFRPHITLGKIAKGKHLKTNVYQPAGINLNINKISLYQSTSNVSGSIYTVLKEAQLK
ncbi:MAG: RNA 2',3'-cyclic phosphodiesterase [Proteobacteria bacterium]|nr:RNA 2',3'-cyclic phosphodiesterase [Pseudomonadota bacterium]